MLRPKSILSLLCIATAIIAGPLHAELLLTGKLYGDWDPLSPGDRGYSSTTIKNTSTQSIFTSGTQYKNGGRTTLTFTDKKFTNKSDGDLLAFDFLKIFNAPTLVGTTADFGNIDLYLDLTSLGISHFLLSSVEVGIDNTANNGVGNIPDLFIISHTTPQSLVFGYTKITFDLRFPETYETFPGQQIPEKGTDTTGELYVHFSAVPEPSTYALAGVVLLAGVVGYRRRFGARATTTV